ncbi:MAG: hypothetical protein ABIK92_09905 [Pseudomonadota bacterium]
MGTIGDPYRLFGLLAVCFLFVGCANATPYQPMGFTGGYKDTHVKDDVYFVEVRCNAFTDHSTAVQYLHRRAMEVCKENGYCDYRLKGERDSSGHGYIGSYGSGYISAGGIQYPARNAYIECIKCPKKGQE